MIRTLIAISCVLCFTLTGFAEDSAVLPDAPSRTSLKFVSIPTVKQLNNSEQIKVKESYSDLSLQMPSAGMLEETPFGFAKEGAWRWTLQFGLGVEFDDTNNSFALGGFGFSFFPVDDLSINFEFNGMYFDQDMAQEAGGFNFNLLLRWHYMTREKWSAFLEMGGGILITTDEVPAGGSGFNFTPQAGAGISVDVGNDVRLLTGVRSHHISNARTFDNNPGQDSFYGFVGLSMPF